MTAMLASIKGWIPPRLLAFFLIGVVAVFYIIFYRLIRWNSNERRAAGEFDKPLGETTRHRYRSTIRRLKIFVAILVFSLVDGLWSMRGDTTIPLVARIAGPAVNILLTIYCLWMIRSLQSRLR
jgi:hypothetical protein